jgi:hypothetical protein
MTRVLLALVRIALPVAVAVVGAVLVVVGDDVARGAGIVLIGVAGLVVLANLLMRLGLSSERDREREEERRRAFSRTGHWPKEGSR